MHNNIVSKWLLFANGNSCLESIVLEAVGQLPERIALLRHSLQASDLKQLAETAHALKGTYGNLQIKEVSALGASLYNELEKEAPDKKLLDELITALETLLHSIPGNYLTGTAAESPEEQERHQGHTVLIVDDEDLNRELFANLCAEILSLSCDTAAEGTAALSLAREHQYRLVMLDVHMPGLSGIEVVKQLRTLPGYAETPILAITGDSGEANRQALLAAGFSECWCKPFNLMTIGKRISELLKV